MTEIKKTLAILKSRQFEVALIIGTHFLAILPRKLFSGVGAKSILTIYSVTLFVPLLFSLISTLLCIGFLRTVYLEDTKRQSPFILLRIGIHFLWRMFVLGMIYSLPFILQTIIYSQFIYKYISYSTLTSSHIFLWFNTLCPISLRLVLIKLIVLTPALIIVLDCRVFDSLKFLKQYKLSNAKELVFLYCGNIALGLFKSILLRYCLGTGCSDAAYCDPIIILRYFLATVFSIAGYFIGFMISIMAVRFVASPDSAYGDYGASLNSESLQEY
jgi:hypothetical protein